MTFNTLSVYANDCDITQNSNSVKYDMPLYSDSMIQEFDLTIPYDGTFSFHMCGMDQNQVQVMITGESDRVVLAETFTGDATRNIVAFAGDYFIRVELTEFQTESSCHMVVHLPEDPELILQDPSTPLAQTPASHNGIPYELIWGSLCILGCVVYLGDYYKKNL